MSDHFRSNGASHSGFRLHKLEVFNWGTFDSSHGEVHRVEPAGQTTLLIGQNGSGKSTLVDALLTLLVRPVVRNYNVAAGAQKQERDERTYIRGAFGHSSRDEDNRAELQFLRPGGSHYSVLLACFRNASHGDGFTLALVLYLDAEGSPKKVYCFASGERSIAQDFARLTSTDRIKQQLEQRGFRATPHYTEYHSWFAKATGVRSKAMDMFNQTVAVKDIQSLNRFIRDHMLEAKPWGEKVDSLLNHFTQLSKAHQSLMRVQRQAALLEPIAELGQEYQSRAGQLGQTRRLIEASDSFFHSKVIELFTPACEELRTELTLVVAHKQQLTDQIQEVQEERRRLRNEIEQCGGERLREIPHLIAKHEAEANAKRDANRRYHEAIHTAGLTGPVKNTFQFAAVSNRLSAELARLGEQLAAGETRRVDLAVKRRELMGAIVEDQRELTALGQRQRNLPEHLAELRSRLCDDLGLQAKDVPFAAELIAVMAGERRWQASIEMVLRNFALSLLVPQQLYSRVSSYVERTRLADCRDRGQRLVYLRVGERRSPLARPALHSQSLLRKLEFREGQTLLPWVKAELEERFDFRCCETIEEFQAAPDLALTSQRHIKNRGVRHEKDDRERVTDPRFFVLGWDNREKRRLLAEQLRLNRDELDRLDRQTRESDDLLQGQRRRQVALEELRKFPDFHSIHFTAHENEIAALNLEKKALEESSDAIRVLNTRLSEAQSREQALTVSRDNAVGRERELKRQIEDANRHIANAQRRLDERQADGTLDCHATSFPLLETFLGEQPLTPFTLFEQQNDLGRRLHADLERLRAEIEPLRSELTTAMNRFLREFPAEGADLDAKEEYLQSFLGLREHIEREDLPRHQKRFKDRLNEKVTHEIGLLNGAFQSDCTEIRSKIELLNQSLRQLEYRPGTYMVLEPRPVRDREIADFQDSLKECLAGTFEGSPEADEARFLRIEKLITRLREERQWREKVTDVRRWFHFAARELDEETGVERGYYEDSTGQSGGEKSKLAFTILVAAIAYQYDIDPHQPADDRFRFVVVDEMFSKVDDQYAEYALELFQKFDLQLLIVAPLDAKARVTEPYVGCYLHVVKDAQSNHSEVFSMTAREFEEAVAAVGANGNGRPTTEVPVGRTLPR